MILAVYVAGMEGKRNPYWWKQKQRTTRKTKTKVGGQCDGFRDKGWSGTD
jgi:hypothetical protein